MKKVIKPVYYWCTYWQKWDEILGWNEENGYIVVREVGTDKVREHCTTIEKECLSIEVVNREDYRNPPIRYKEFYGRVKSTSGQAWAILRDSGVPRRLIKFDYER